MDRFEKFSDVWERQFGEEYTKRKLQSHDSEAQLREPFWKQLVKMVPDAKSFLEIGCNAGMNMEAISSANPELDIIGIEPNEFALKTAQKRAKKRFQVLKGSSIAIPSSLKPDLVFTCTVLIHIAPDNLLETLKNLYSTSQKYILTMEYYWPVVKQIEYRELKDALWKQDFGALWLQHFKDIELIETGYLGPKDGFDRVTWWLFKK